jgi:uncharacterized membrane protein YqiK
MEMLSTFGFIAAIIGFLFLLFLGVAVAIAKFYQKVEQGKTLIVNRLRAEPDVTFSGALVWPIIHKSEVMDISVKTIEIDRRGKEGLICKDNIRADIKVSFFLRVNPSREDVLKVAKSIGCARASDHETLEELFSAKFSEALKTVGKQLDFEELYKEREGFKDQIVQVIGKDLNGYVLEDAAIDFLEQTALESLDPQNILDAQGIKKITEITVRQNVLTNDLKQNERKELTKQNVEADESVFELERQRADAEAKKNREIANVQSRESAETEKVAAEEQARAGKARIKAEEEVAIEEENKARQVEVAKKNRERVIGIEHERVEKDRLLEQINRERATELQTIEKEKALEIEKKSIADVVRDRIAVEKNVAEEEERIKDLRALAEANRVKDVVRITAEGEAQEKLVKDIKAAEAQEEVAKYEARQRLTVANASLEAADKEAQAKIRLSEGQQAEEAASGLAAARVMEADAMASEKQGLAKVHVQEAEALAIEKRGLAQVQIKEADAEAGRKLGLAQAEVQREQLLAEAAGEQEKGMALVRVQEQEAAVIEKRGEAEAKAAREKLLAEAAGLAEKAEAMKALDGVGREHEEFRLQLQKDQEVAMESIRVRQHIAQAQAEVLAQAFGQAKLNIVGGDGEFFERFVKAVTFGQSVDGALDSSDALRTALQGYLNGSASLPEDLKQVLSRPALNSEGIQRMTLSALLAKLMVDAGSDDRTKLQQVLEQVKDLGLAKLPAKN